MPFAVALERGIRRRRWTPEDVELVARSAYMLGRDDDYVRGLERAHGRTSTPAMRARRALRVLDRPQPDVPRPARSREGVVRPRRSGCSRARGGTASNAAICSSRSGWSSSASGDFAAAHATAAERPRIGERVGDRDLAGSQGGEAHALVRQGRVEDGLRLVDEMMVAVTAGELSPIVAGIVYCNTIAFCRASSRCGAPASGPPR